MKSSTASDPDYDLWILLYKTRRTIFRVRQKELKDCGTSTRRAAVLHAIYAIGDMATPAVISRWIYRESHSVSELLSRMEKEDLVKKVRNLDRKNMVRVMLTKKGLEAYEYSTRRESIHDIMSVLSRKEREELESYLRTIQLKAMSILGIEMNIPFPPSKQLEIPVERAEWGT